MVLCIFLHFLLTWLGLGKTACVEHGNFVFSINLLYEDVQTVNTLMTLF